MLDVVDSAKRSQMMSGIKGKNTRPELFVRRYLHSAGFRFRLHRKDLLGCPDLTLSKYRLVIFVHGCFWHRHESCFYTTSPSSRKEFWGEKFKGNVERDEKHVKALLEAGWRVLVIWECGIKHSLEELGLLQDLIKGTSKSMVWPSRPPKIKL